VTSRLSHLRRRPSVDGPRLAPVGEGRPAQGDEVEGEEDPAYTTRQLQTEKQGENAEQTHQVIHAKASIVANMEQRDLLQAGPRRTQVCCEQLLLSKATSMPMHEMRPRVWRRGRKRARSAHTRRRRVRFRTDPEEAEDGEVDGNVGQGGKTSFISRL
jgi:hypothetical protein